jgi:predicted nuclease of predicted toxin-antitoxin system
MAARDLGAVVVTKDRDFLDSLERYGPPPQVIWVTCGNSSNAYLRAVFERTLPTALVLLGQGEPFLEISDAN